jgi:hypothetical protein
MTEPEFNLALAGGAGMLAELPAGFVSARSLAIMRASDRHERREQEVDAMTRAMHAEARADAAQLAGIAPKTHAEILSERSALGDAQDRSALAKEWRETNMPRPIRTTDVLPAVPATPTSTAERMASYLTEIEQRSAAKKAAEAAAKAAVHERHMNRWRTAAHERHHPADARWVAAWQTGRR